MRALIAARLFVAPAPHFTSSAGVRGGAGTRRVRGAVPRAVDVNPIENPSVYPDGTTAHRASRRYVDRSRHRRGMAYRGGVLVRAFARVGRRSSGDWHPPTATDYQHFSTTGR